MWNNYHFDLFWQNILTVSVWPLVKTFVSNKPVFSLIVWRWLFGSKQNLWNALQDLFRTKTCIPIQYLQQLSWSLVAEENKNTCSLLTNTIKREKTGCKVEKSTFKTASSIQLVYVTTKNDTKTTQSFPANKCSCREKRLT